MKFHADVLSNDGHKLGAAQALFHSRGNVDDIETQPYRRHLKIFNFETGESYFVPTEYLDQSADLTIVVRASHQSILHEGWDRTPRYIAYDDAEVETLATD